MSQAIESSVSKKEVAKPPDPREGLPKTAGGQPDHKLRCV